MRVPRSLLAVALAALVAAAVPASAQDLSDLRERQQELESQRNQNAEQQAVLASELDAEQATAAEVAEALDALQADLDIKEARLAAALDAVERAEEQIEASDAERERILAEAAQLEGDLAHLAVQAYIDPPGDEVLEALVSGRALDAPYRRVLLDATSEVGVDALDRYREIEEELEEQARLADEARELADQRRRIADEELAVVEEARARQLEFAEQVNARIDHLLSEAASLEAVDAELAAEIRGTEEAIAAKVAEIEAAERAAREAAARAAASNRGGGNFPTSGEIVNVGGINVHVSIADNVAALLSAAAADGIALGGGGYRSNASQIALRRAHCGSSDYAIYSAPASSCSPPTARPGRSNHERGLAIDFTYGGRGITSRSSPAFQWLAANASRFGLYNLPSEPWHWSVNGQ